MTILYSFLGSSYINLSETTKEIRASKDFRKSIYVNLTNRCPCSCTFCLRNTKEMNENNTLWLDREPSVSEITTEFEKYDLNEFNEVIFCGFGEPLERANDLIEVAKYIKKMHPSMPTRINSNGLANLIHQKNIPELLNGLIDTISISLNASNKEEFFRLTRSKFGIKSYDAMLQFAVDCKNYIPNVVLTVVDCIGEKEIKDCQAVCENLGLTLRIRPFE